MEVILSEYPHGSQSQTSSWDLSLCLTTLPPSSSAKWSSAVISMVNLLCFALWSPTVALHPLWRFWSSHLAPSVMRFPSVWELFLLHDSLTQGTSPYPEICCLFLCLYPLPYCILRRSPCLVGSLGSSAVVQKLFCRSCSTFWWIFDVSVGRKASSLSYSSTIFRFLVLFLNATNPSVSQFPPEI